MGYVISVILMVVSVAAIAGSALMLRGRDYATAQRGGGGLARRRMTPAGKALAWAFVVPVLLLVLAPHVGILLLSLATIWSFSPLPDGFTLAHYATVLRETPQFLTNTLPIAAAGLIDVVLAVAIACCCTHAAAGRQLLDLTAMAALAVPGWCSHRESCALFRRDLPGGTSPRHLCIMLTSCWRAAPALSLQRGERGHCGRCITAWRMRRRISAPARTGRRRERVAAEAGSRRRLRSPASPPRRRSCPPRWCW